jgi:hypothetical protein
MGNGMRKLATVIGLFAVVAIVPATQALAAPLLDDPFRSTHYAGYGLPLLLYGGPSYSATYSANSDRLRMRASVLEADFTPFDEVGPYFTSQLDIEAGIDASGNVIDSGYLIWYGDFGSGSEVLATAHLTDIGFGESATGGEPGSPDFHYAWLSVRLLFDIDYLSPLVPGKSPFLGIWLEHVLKSPYDSPFVEDWTCRSGGEGTRCNEPHSTSALAGLTVAEPASSVLWGLALASLLVFVASGPPHRTLADVTTLEPSSASAEEGREGVAQRRCTLSSSSAVLLMRFAATRAAPRRKLRRRTPHAAALRTDT